MTPERSKKTNPEHRVFYRTTSGWQEGKERKEETTLDFKRQDMKCPEKENLHKKESRSVDPGAEGSKDQLQMGWEKFGGV